MNRHFAVVSLLASLLLLPSLAKAQNRPASHPAGSSLVDSVLIPFTHFSATVSGGLVNESSKRMYRSGNRIRVDLTGKFHLTDLHNHSTWAVHPDRCSHFPVPDVTAYPFLAFQGFKVERSPSDEIEGIGGQTIDGHPSRRENVTLTPNDGGGAAFRVRLWKAQDLQDFPLKIEIDRGDKRTITVNFSDVSLEPPSEELFEIPSKCPDGPAHGQKGVHTLTRASAAHFSARQIP